MGGALHRAYHADVPSAAAQVVFECGSNLRRAGMGVYVEQRLGGENEAADAVAALRGLFLDEGSLQWMRVLRCAQALDRRYFAFADVGERKHTSVPCFPGDQDRARPTRTVRAAHFRAGQAEAFAKHQYERHLGIRVDAMWFPIHNKPAHATNVAMGWENRENVDEGKALCMQVEVEPIGSEARYHSELSRLLEEMGRARNDLYSLNARESGGCGFVERDHL